MLVVFVCFSVWFLNFNLGWNHLAAFECIAAAGFFVFHEFKSAIATTVESSADPAYTALETGKDQLANVYCQNHRRGGDRDDSAIHLRRQRGDPAL